MIEKAEIRELYKEIQKQLFHMIPEKWRSLYLYASVTEKDNDIETGEMYFYYFPNGILKKNPVNVYEIPSKFNIDEEEYMKLVKNLYSSIKELRRIYITENQDLWTNVTISMENNKFKIEYNYDKLDNTEEENYIRHIIWRYKRLGIDINSFDKSEKKIIDKYLREEYLNIEKTEEYIEGIYKKPLQNSLDYEKTVFTNTDNRDIMNELDTNGKNISNQILAGLIEKK